VTIYCLGSHRLPSSRWRRILTESFSCTDNNAQRVARVFRNRIPNL
jgi:hypothetical protein